MIRTSQKEIKNTQLNAKELILSDRTYFMGLAMLMVICFHFVSWVGFGKFLLPFLWGYIGVDIFLFFSGIGLYFSYKKYSYLAFIQRRAIRIIPLYMVGAVLDTAITSWQDGISFSSWDWFCNITSLSYYHIGGYLRDWYLSSLILLYLTFPIAYKYVNKCKSRGVIFTVILGLLAIIFVYSATGKNMPFQYNCLISRIPIFLLGILVYDRYTDIGNIENQRYRKVMWISMVLGMMFLVADRLIPISIGFVATALIAPALIYGLAMLHRHIGKSLMRIIRFIGIYSLEFYVGNLIIHVTIDIMPSKMAKVAYYIIGNLVFALMLIPFNKLVAKYCSSLIKR